MRLSDLIEHFLYTNGKLDGMGLATTFLILLTGFFAVIILIGGLR